MKAKILRLRPDTRFHFGKPMTDGDTSLASTDPFPSSDLLFSALVNNLATVQSEEEVARFIDAFKQGHIKISSCFYCIEDTRMKDGPKIYTYLLPRPANAVSRVDRYKDIKKVKKVQFVDNDTLNSSNPSDWLVFGSVAFSKNMAENLLGKEQAKSSQFALYHHTMATQVGLHHTKQDEQGNEVSAGPYYVDAIQIADLAALKLRVHFYFLYEITDSSIQPAFDLAVSLLAYNGIGGERSAGYGTIESIEEAESLPELFRPRTESTHHLLMSKFIPHDQADLSQVKAYTSTIRGGRRTEGGTLQSVRMINEGAIIAGNCIGKVEDISPRPGAGTHFRNGKALLIPLPSGFQMED